MARRPRLLIALSAGMALLGCGCATTAPSLPADSVVVATDNVNPVFAGADPHLAVLSGRYWIYATAAGAADGRPTSRFYAFSSPDLRRWTRSGPVFRIEDAAWIEDDGAPEHFLWAPAIAEANGRYYLYFSVGPQNPTPSRIGVAVSDSPAGPFKDSGRPLIADGGNGFEAIDPMVFRDPKTGTTYLYAGGSAGAKLRAWILDASMTAVEREVAVAQPEGFTEGAFVHERDGVYHLTYSRGRWNQADYSAHHATGPTPLGPWTYRGPILVGDDRRKGPGHHSIVQNPRTKAWFIAYHRWETTQAKGPFTGDRQIAIQPLPHGAGGAIPRLSLDAEVPRSPLS